MSGDMMPKEQHDFIKGIQDYMLEATNMGKDEAWSFGFRIWQSRNWLRKYMAIEVSEDCISRAAAIDIIKNYDFEFPEYMERFVNELRDAMKKDLVEDITNAPSVTTEQSSKVDIVHCKDCFHYTQRTENTGICDFWNAGVAFKDFCSMANQEPIMERIEE